MKYLILLLLPLTLYPEKILWKQVDKTGTTVVTTEKTVRVEGKYDERKIKQSVPIRKEIKITITIKEK